MKYFLDLSIFLYLLNQISILIPTSYILKLVYKSSQNHLADTLLPQLLENIDQEVAEKAHQGGCLYCGEKLHRGDYDRKPRGGPAWDRRYSFCCSAEGCRRRLTPPSVRFLGRRIYAGFIVVLLAAMTHGLSPGRVETLRKTIGADRRTLARWRQWWLQSFDQQCF